MLNFTYRCCFNASMTSCIESARLASVYMHSVISRSLDATKKPFGLDATQGMIPAHLMWLMTRRTHLVVTVNPWLRMPSAMTLDGSGRPHDFRSISQTRGDNDAPLVFV